MNWPEQNPWNPGTQDARVWYWLKAYGKITTDQLHKMGLDTARARAQRYQLYAHGMRLTCHHIKGVRNNCEYRVEEL